MPVITIQMSAGHSSETKRRLVASLTAAASHALDVENGAIKPPPAFGTALDSSFILGLANVGSKMVMLLDADRLLSEQEMAGLAGAAIDT